MGGALELAVARERELKDRIRAGRTGFRIVARPMRRFGTWHVRSNASGRTYEVLWPAEGLMACSCPDARTSELPRCKHSAYVESKAPKRGEPLDRVVVMIRPAPSTERVQERLRDLQVYMREGRSPAVHALLDSQGRVRAGTDAGALYEALLHTRSLQWGEGVAELLLSLMREDAWACRFRRFEKRVRTHLERDGQAPRAWARMQRALTCTLRPYQVDGVLFAARERRALLADDMGLGKTLQAIATMLLLREMGEPMRTLVVCPSSVKSQWKSEIEKFAPGLRATVIEGSRVQRRLLIARGDADVYILNFATLRNDLGELRALRPELLVVDEAQRIKNWNTKTAKAVKSLCGLDSPSCPRVLALTGTPLENRLAELHSVMELLDSRALGPLWRLSPEHAVVSEESGRVEGVRRLGLLRQRMGTRWLRRTKGEVLHELPEREDDTALAEWSDAQQAAHARHLQSCALILRKKRLTKDDFLRLMSEMQSMRLISNGLALYLYDELAPQLDGLSDAQLLKRYPSPKLELARDVLTQLIESGEKVVVFSQWRRTLSLTHRLIEGALRKAGARAIHFHGGLSTAERASAVATFHEDAEARVFFATDAGGVGLNLQDAASTVVHLETPWNPAVFEQRVGRVHRMGQKRKVRVLSLRSEGGIEPRVASGMVHKQALFDGLFGGADELRFVERESFVERMKDIVGAQASGPPSTSLVQLEALVDETTCLVPPEVPMELPESALQISEEGTGSDFASAENAHADGDRADGDCVEVRLAGSGSSVRALREGDAVKIELSGIGGASWMHLKAFLESLA